MTDDVYQRIDSRGVNPLTTPRYSIIEIQPGMNVTQVQVVGGGGAGNGGLTLNGTGAGGGGGAFASKNVTLSPGDKLAYYLGAGALANVGTADTVFLLPQRSSVCLANNPSVFLDITGTTSSSGSSDFKGIAQTFTTSANNVILHSVQCNLYTDDASSGFWANLTLGSPTGNILAASERVPASKISADGSIAVEFIFGSVYLDPSTTYAIVFNRTLTSNNGTIFGARYVSDTYAGGTRWNRDFSDIYTQISAEDLEMSITTFPAENLLALSEVGSNASGSTGGAGGSAATSIGDTTFSGGNGGNAQGGGGSRAGSGGGAAGSSSGAGGAGGIGSGNIAGLGGVGAGTFVNIPTDGGDGCINIGLFNAALNGIGVGGGGGGASNNADDFPGSGAGGALYIVYTSTRNRSDSRMLAIFSPI